MLTNTSADIVRFDLKNIVSYLVWNRELVLDTDVKALSLNQLQRICESYTDRVTCVLDLNELRNRRCPACITKLAECTETGPYEQPDGSAIPQIPGLFCTGAVTPEAVQEHRFHWITSGTTIGMIRNPDTGERQIAFFVHIPVLNDVSTDSLLNWQEFGDLIHEVSNLLRIGKMYAIGYRRAYDKVPYSFYARPDRCKRGELKGEWDEYQRSVYRITEILETEFAKTCINEILEKAQSFVAGHILPPLGATSVDPKKSGPGCNFTIPCKCFANQSHLDHDAFEYVFSVYVFIDRNGNLVTDQERIRKCMKGGQFIWPGVHVGIDTSECSGIVMFLWCGTHERHCTMTSELCDEDTIRIGTSIQVNQQLFDSVATYQANMAAYEESLRNPARLKCKKRKFMRR
ncbi:hypothetical protein FRC10_010273 [Ceratobasidium sp. 414]|nr:hypothetical protein FRC10_010273 [Ceratobasidium sp. 414]